MLILQFNNDYTYVRFMESIHWMPRAREIAFKNYFRDAGYKNIKALKSKYL